MSRSTEHRKPTWSVYYTGGKIYYEWRVQGCLSKKKLLAISAGAASFLLTALNLVYLYLPVLLDFIRQIWRR